MQVLQTPHWFLFSLPKPRKPSAKCRHSHRRWPVVWFPTTRIILKPPKTTSEYRGEFQVDRDEDPELWEILYGDQETEEEARRRDWMMRDWAPWDTVPSPEMDFAMKSVEYKKAEVPLQTPEVVEAFKMLRPSYRDKVFKESGLNIIEYYRKHFEIKGEKPEELKTVWTSPLVVALVAPRDWPPRGWEVDREELEFIREGHRIIGEESLTLDRLEGSRTVKEGEEGNMCLDRYKMFLKQYKEWVAANKNRLEKESYQIDQDYYPGRRKRGKDYKEDMYELPFYYPGQICEGKVTCLALYHGAFVDIGGVHDGWVPIKGNDWFWLRHHIKVGMHVIVEVMAKRDPHLFRFPIELRFVFPNIDHLIFNRFEFPPIFHRVADVNWHELQRESGRPPVPRVEHETKPEDEPLVSNHPYVGKLWQIHVAEQMILDDWEANPEKYKGKKISELSDDDDYDEMNNVIHTQAYHDGYLLPKTILKTSVKELDLEAALAEREHHNKLKAEAKERGEKYKVTRLRRNAEMDEYDLLHWRRAVEEREALIRDISCRQALGLPLEEPGRYKPESFFIVKNKYDPQQAGYRHDYWGEPTETLKSVRRRRQDLVNKGITGGGTLCNEASLDDLIKRKMRREARSAEMDQKAEDSGKNNEEDEDKDESEEEEDEDKDEGEEEDDDDEDWDYRILSNLNANNWDLPIIYGSDSPGDEFEIVG